VAPTGGWDKPPVKPDVSTAMSRRSARCRPGCRVASRQTLLLAKVWPLTWLSARHS